jgi:ABC-2 type transport system ATP-binding protein
MSNVSEQRRTPEKLANAAKKGAEPLLRVRELVRSYGPRRALDRVSLEVLRGETLALLGVNGAGKTTLIHLLAGLSDPDSGSVRFVDGSDPRATRARSKIGVAFQDLAVYPELEVAENVRFFARLYGLHSRALDDAVDEALERVALTDRRHCRAKSLSGGMLRRLNLACAIAHRPDLLLLDEPTAALDPKSRALLVEGLARIAASGTTIVLSTHHLEDAERLSDRVAILDSGRLVAIGTPEELAAEHGGGLVEVEIEKSPTNLRLRWVGGQPFEDAARLLRSGERVKKLRAEAASLETVFFTLTGRRLEEP